MNLKCSVVCYVELQWYIFDILVMQLPCSEISMSETLLFGLSLVQWIFAVKYEQSFSSFCEVTQLSSNRMSALLWQWNWYDCTIYVRRMLLSTMWYQIGIKYAKFTMAPWFEVWYILKSCRILKEARSIKLLPCVSKLWVKPCVRGNWLRYACLMCTVLYREWRPWIMNFMKTPSLETRHNVISPVI